MMNVLTLNHIIKFLGFVSNYVDVAIVYEWHCTHVLFSDSIVLCSIKFQRMKHVTAKAISALSLVQL